jgi:hypothetical protein
LSNNGSITRDGEKLARKLEQQQPQPQSPQVLPSLAS